MKTIQHRMITTSSSALPDVVQYGYDQATGLLDHVIDPDPQPPTER